MQSPENQRDPNDSLELAERLTARIRQAWPVERWGCSPVVVGVSGGADSVALLVLLRRIAQQMGEQQATGQPRFVIAHVNHRLRGTDSDGDRDFVIELGKRWGLPVRVLESPQQSPESRSEADLRDERYHYFESVACDYGARYVATAHHADDHIETLLFRLFRGSAMRGLRGIPATRLLAPQITLVRPLLGCRRSELREFLQEIGQPFREDRTNTSSAYTRNRIRHKILPMLEAEFGPRLTQRLLRFSQQMSRVDAFLSSLAEQGSERAVLRRDADEIVVSASRFNELAEVIQRHLVVMLWDQQGWPRGDLAESDIDDVLRCLAAFDSVSLRHQFPGKITISGKGDQKTIRREP